MAFNAIVDADSIGAFIDTCSTLVDEARIHLEGNGLRIQAVEPANVGMVSAMIGTGAFESYEADGGLIGMDLEKLQNAMKFAGSEDLTHWWLDEETRKLHIETGGLELTYALIDPDSIRQEPDLPDLDLPSKVVIEGRDFDRAVKAADLVSDHVLFQADEAERSFTVDAEGDTDDVSFELAGEDLLEGTEIEGTAESLFSLDYLKDMNKAIPKDGELTIRVGEEHPCKLSFEYSEGEGSASYMLAPRIRSD